MTRAQILAIGLFVSLTVNLFLGGLMIGRWLDHDDGPHWSRTAPEGPGPHWLRRSLGPEGMPVLERVWATHAEDIDPLRDRARAARREVREALATEPFDPDRYAAALIEMRSHMVAMFTGIDAVMIELAQQLTPEQRRQIADRGRKGARRSPPAN